MAIYPFHFRLGENIQAVAIGMLCEMAPQVNTAELGGAESALVRFAVARFWAVIEKWRIYKGRGTCSGHSCATLSTVFVHKKPDRLRIEPDWLRSVESKADRKSYTPSPDLRCNIFPRALTISVAGSVSFSAGFFHAIRPNGILTNSLQSTTPANSPLPAESSSQNNRNLAHHIVFNGFILVRFLGGY